MTVSQEMMHLYEEDIGLCLVICSDLGIPVQ